MFTIAARKGVYYNFNKNTNRIQYLITQRKYNHLINQTYRTLFSTPTTITNGKLRKTSLSPHRYYQKQQGQHFSILSQLKLHPNDPRNKLSMNNNIHENQKPKGLNLPELPYDPKRAVNTADTMPEENIVILVESLAESFGVLNDLQQHPLRFRGWNWVLRPHFRPSITQGNDYTSSRASVSSIAGQKEEVSHADAIIDALADGGIRTKGLATALSKAPPEYVAFLLLGAILITIQDEYSDGWFGNFNFDEWADGYWRQLLILIEQRFELAEKVKKLEKQWDDYETTALQENFDIDNPKEFSFQTKFYFWARDVFLPQEFEDRAKYKESKMEHDQSVRLKELQEKEELQTTLVKPSELLNPHKEQERTLYDKLVQREEERDRALLQVEQLRLRMIRDNRGMPLTGSQQTLIKQEYKFIADEYKDLDIDVFRIQELLEEQEQHSQQNNNNKKDKDKFDYSNYARSQRERQIQSELLHSSDRLLRFIEEKQKPKSFFDNAKQWGTHTFQSLMGTLPTYQPTTQQIKDDDFDSLDGFYTSKDNEVLTEYQKHQQQEFYKQQQQLQEQYENENRQEQLNIYRQEQEREARDKGEYFKDEYASDIYGIHGPQRGKKDKVLDLLNKSTSNNNTSSSSSANKTKRNPISEFFFPNWNELEEEEKLKSEEADRLSQYSKLQLATLSPDVQNNLHSKTNPFTMLTEREKAEARRREEMKHQELELFKSTQQQELRESLQRETYYKELNKKQQNPIEMGQSVIINENNEDKFKPNYQKEDDHERRIKGGFFGRWFG